MACRCTVLRIAVATGLLLGVVAGASAANPPVAVNGCVSEVFGANVVCTANDVQLTDIINPVILDGCDFVGDTATFTGTAVVQLTAQARYDVGIYISSDGDPNGDDAESGTCDITILSNAPSPPFVNLDGDTCGDIDETYKAPAAPLLQPIGPITIKCIDNNGDGKADIPHCETWRQPGDNSPCANPLQAVVGAPSKCNCGTLSTVCIVIDDGNPCTDDLCDGNGNVIHPPKAAGTACGEQTPQGPCDNPDVCDGKGVCQPNYKTATTVCRSANGQCDVAESCTGTGPLCPANAYAPKTTACVGTSNGGACDGTDSCDGAGVCVDGFKPSTTVCRAAAGQCDVAESCTGTSGACPANGYAPKTTACVGTSNGGACDGTDSCDGAGVCVDGFKPSTTVCRAAAGQCDVAESCTGTSGACPANGYAPKTTACVGTSNGGACDATDSCNGSGVCVDGFKPSTTVCRAAAGQCDVAESCTGTSGACPANHYAPSTTTCVGTSNGGPCDATDSCNGSGVCVDGFKPETTICREKCGQCDVAESCTGSSGQCPANGYAPKTTPCVGTSNGGVCDGTDSCDGNGNCVDGFLPETTICRPKASQCDIAESCPGTGPNCPEDTDECKAICRTPGFWGTHPTETQTLLSAAGSLSVCGVTVKAYDDCAAEGLCNAPRGDKKLILARQLLTTALNCVLTSGDYTCGGTTTDLGKLFKTCNTACIANNNAGAIALCISQLDCSNNGGEIVGGKCALGTCSATKTYCGGGYGTCPISVYPSNTCEPFPGNCHDQPLDAGAVYLSEPPNPADPQLCHEATQSTNTLFTAGVCPQ
jgi:hypothetical protein